MASNSSLGALRRALNDPLGVALRRSLLTANSLFAWAAGGENRQAFFDIDKTCPALRILEQNYQIIRDELESVLSEKHRIPRLHELVERETYISGTVDREKDWRIFVLATAAAFPPSSRAKCPQTTALLARIPGLAGASFSILDPGKSIPAHCGPYLGILRYHMGLRIPTNAPPYIRIKDKSHTWKEGEGIIFDDSWEHEVYNRSDDIRVVLIVDFFRPMALPIHAVNWSFYKMLAHFSGESKDVLEKIEKYSPNS
jgi:aspartyl/asparaginyl beta-hydroxylase (cupin superfamily)